MTITNHTKRIDVLAALVTVHVDKRSYPDAHCCLDDIEKEVRAAHRHIDNLQLKAECAARPAGGD